MRTEALKKAQSKYEKENITSVRLKLNNKTDADIIAFLDTCDNKQGTIKAILRVHIENK